MNRNFRSTYLQSLGFHGIQDGVQVKLSLEAVLNEEEIDINKLSKLCVTFGVPSAYRVSVWKILLGILPTIKSNWELFEETRLSQFNYVKRLMSLMSCSTTKMYTERCSENSESTNSDVDAPFITNMCLLTKKQSVRCPETTKDLDSCQHIVSIASVLLEICEEAADAYWLCLKLLSNSGLCRPFSQYMNHFTSQVALLEKLLSTEHTSMFQLFNKYKVNISTFATRWFRSFFAESFAPSSVSRIWERVIGSPQLTVVCIALSIIATLSPKISTYKKAADIEKFLLFIPDGNTDRIIIGGVQYYEKFGGSGSLK